MKKLFFTLCALCLCGTMWAQDATQDTDTGLWYTVEDGVATIVAVPEGETAYTVANLVNYTGNEATDALTLPETIGDNSPVVAIGESAFNGALTDTQNQIHLVIPSYINTVGASAFYGCTGIKAVTFEYSATALTDENGEAWASMFYNCSGITEVTLNRNYSNAGNHNGGGAAFSYLDNIAEVFIGENVTAIASYMFRANSSAGGALKTVVCYAAEPPAIDNTVFDRHNSTTFELYVGYDYVNIYKADDTWSSIFGDANIHSITGEDPEPEVDENAFQYEGLWYDPRFAEDGTETGEAEIIAPVEGEYSGEITIPATATNETTGKTYNVTRIAPHAFKDSSIKGTLVIPANITALGKGAFVNCTSIDEVTFEYSSVELYDENDDNSAESYCFGGCKMSKVNLYRDYTLAAGTNVICAPFCYFTTIQEINIGPRVKEIPHHMFNSNSAQVLKTVNCYALEPPTLDNTTFRSNSWSSDGCYVYVPQGVLSAYQGDTGTYGWASFSFSGFAELDNAFAITTHNNNEGTAYATFYNGASDVELFNGELTAYQATQLDSENGELIIDISSLGSVIPASTGVVVETPTADTYLAIATTENATAATNNLLYGETDENGYTVAPNGGSVDDYYYYLLSSYDNQVGFYYGAQGGAAFICQAHRAYLALPTTAVTNATHISIRKGNGGEDTTGISSVESAVEGASVKGIYTVQGVRVSNMNQPGLYIVDGKKVLVK